MDINKIIHGILDKLEKSNSFYLPETAIIYLLDHSSDFRELVDSFTFYDTWESVYSGVMRYAPQNTRIRKKIISLLLEEKSITLNTVSVIMWDNLLNKSDYLRIIDLTDSYSVLLSIVSENNTHKVTQDATILIAVFEKIKNSKCLLNSKSATIKSLVITNLYYSPYCPTFLKSVIHTMFPQYAE